jgi:Trichohyalin-plectin-homology domain
MPLRNRCSATDDLRKEAGKFNVQQCQMEREKQLMEKKRLAEQKIMEEGIYAQLWKLDLLQKEERERKEAEEKKKRVGDTMAVLDWQKDTRYQGKAQERQLTEQERSMLNDQWRREKEQEAEMERQRAVLGRERNLELIRHNEAEKLLREEQLKAEKDRDRNMLSKAINKEQEIERLEQEELQRRRQEVIDL